MTTKTFQVGQKILYKGQKAIVRRTTILGMIKTNAIQIKLEETGEILTLLHDFNDQVEFIEEANLSATA